VNGSELGSIALASYNLLTKIAVPAHFRLKIPVNIRVSTSIVTALICAAAGNILTDTDAI
jgi:hypothetical protein